MRIKPFSIATIGLAASIVALPVAVIAANYDDDHLPYTDVNASWDLQTRVSVSLLTDEGVLRGNDDGTFAQGRSLNRAEFMQIVMRLMPSDVDYVSRCFPDMPAGVWYEEPVCRAKALGIVSGNALPGLRPDQYPFQPNRPVQYEEAVKVLVELYALPVNDGVQGQWYEKYLRAANDAGINLRGGYAGMQITRGEMARLVANAFAQSRGELNDLREAQGLSVSSSSSSRSSSRSSSSNSSSSSRSSSGSSVSSGGSSSSSFSFSSFDSRTDTSMTSRFLLLDQVSPVVANASVYLSVEPLYVDRIIVVVPGDPNSIDSFEIYRNDGAFLGRATQDSSDPQDYVLNINNGSFVVKEKTSQGIYVRARLKSTSNGGDSGELVQVSAIEFYGYGQWSNTRYSQSYNGPYPVSQTARARLTTFENAGNTSDILVPGTQQILAQFRIGGQETDNLASARITDMVIQANATSGVSLSNVKLGTTDNSDTMSCTYSSGLIQCNNIPVGIGTLDDDIRVYKVIADVALDAGVNSASLQLSLNDPGTPTSGGAITWNDNESIFTWVDKGAPLVRGTIFSR